MLIVGSRALQAHGIKLGRKPSDIDVIATVPQIISWQEAVKEDIKSSRRIDDKKHVFFMKNGDITEFEIASPEINPTALWLLMNYEGLGYPRKVVSWGNAVHPDVVLTLKMSHRYLKNSPHFRKTMDDILALRGLKFRVPPQLQSWLKDREKATYTYAHPSLKRDKAKFFSGDGVNYKYEHDDIHEALATIPFSFWHPAEGHRGHGYTTSRVRPAYVQFQKDADVDVSVSRDKWNKCSEHVKLMSVLEESYVLALERSQIPCDFAIAPRTSFLIALEKVCTSITSGWWREYAWEHYYQVLGMYNDDYVDRFQKALSEGKIRDYIGAAA